MPERPYSSTFDSTTRRLLVRGAIDELSVPAFRADLDEAASTAEPGALTVDLGEVDYFPSVALGALVVAMKRDEHPEQTSKIEVLAAEGTIAQRVLELCGMPHRTS